MSSPDFATDAAAKTGVDKRTIQRNAERGEKVTPAALAMAAEEILKSTTGFSVSENPGEGSCAVPPAFPQNQFSAAPNV